MRLCLNTVAACLAVTHLSGCVASPQFTNPPPLVETQVSFRDLLGVWRAEGKDNGERARAVALAEGGVLIEVFGARTKEAPVPPIAVQVTRFGDSDWALVDRRLLAEPGKTAGERDRIAPFILVRYTLGADGRLCGQALAARPFVEAVRDGKLAGIIDGAPPREAVSIFSNAAAWMNWLESQPASARSLSAQTGCFVRVAD